MSLEAAKRLAALGGCERHRAKGDAWSATVNKFLRENGLAETDRHTAYSLRHAFDERLLAKGVDERVRADLRGAGGPPRLGRIEPGETNSLTRHAEAVTGHHLHRLAGDEHAAEPARHRSAAA